MEYLVFQQLETRYEDYYCNITARDKEEEMRLMRDFAFSDQELEFFLKAEETDAKELIVIK